jgi:hypothetical protein
MIARHPCSYEREGFVFDPLHYLPLLERKIVLVGERYAEPGMLTGSSRNVGLGCAP